jgi:hypothetical protein
MTTITCKQCGATVEADDHGRPPRSSRWLLVWPGSRVEFAPYESEHGEHQPLAFCGDAHWLVFAELRGRRRAFAPGADEGDIHAGLFPTQAATGKGREGRPGSGWTAGAHVRGHVVEFAQMLPIA